MHLLQQKNKDVGAEPLRTGTTSSQSLAITDGLSKLGYTGLFFVDPGGRSQGRWNLHVLLRLAIRQVSVQDTLHCVSKKTTLMLHTIDSTHINRFR